MDLQTDAKLAGKYIAALEQQVAALERQLQASVPQSAGAAEVEPLNGLPESNGHSNSDPDRIDPSIANRAPSVAGQSVSSPINRYKVVRSEFDFKTYLPVDKPIDLDQTEPTAEAPPPEDGDVAFTYRQLPAEKDRLFMEDRNAIAGCEIEIHTEPLQALLKDILAKYLGRKDITRLISGTTEFKALIWAWEEAMQETKQEARPGDPKLTQARKDLGELLKIISSQRSGVDHLQQYFKGRDESKKESTIAFDHLWTLFPPGAQVIGRPFMGQPQLFLVQSCDGWTKKASTADNNVCELRFYCLDWDGKQFSRVPLKANISRFQESKKIIELPFFPIENYMGEEKTNANSEGAIAALKKRLVERGKMYHSLCIAKQGQQMFIYDGQAVRYQTGQGILHASRGALDIESVYDLPTGRRRGSSMNDSLVKVRGVVMVDFISYFEYQSMDEPFMGNLERYTGEMECTCSACRQDQALRRLHRPEWDCLPPQHEFKAEEYIFCPPRVLGYSLKRKQWLQLDVSKLSPPPPANVEVFNSKLQMDEDQKKLIRVAVMAHEAGKQKGKNGQTRGLEDVVEGKGKGLIILLYGLPGVGKTLTAESVALLANKPLFSVGVSEVGIEGDKVETNLQKIFDLASLWEAVLLFDEADVFLEARGAGENDLRRNAMVSVLLRVLEYYEGILILTTNRLKSFDIAVQSRIHLAVKYEDLDRFQRQAIFNTFLEDLEKKKLCDLTEGKGVKEWVEKIGSKFKFNGRQIRNVVSTALAMTRIDEAGKPIERMLKADDLALVAEQTEAFQKDLIKQETIYRQEQMK